MANSLNNLAALYNNQGRNHEAERLYEQALKICERQLGSKHPNIVTNSNNLEMLHNAIASK